MTTTINIFYKVLRLKIIGRSIQRGKISTYSQLAQKLNFSGKNSRNWVFSSQNI